MKRQVLYIYDYTILFPFRSRHIFFLFVLFYIFLINYKVKKYENLYAQFQNVEEIYF